MQGFSLKVIFPDGSQIRLKNMQPFFPVSEPLVLNAFYFTDIALELFHPNHELTGTEE